MTVPPVLIATAATPGPAHSERDCCHRLIRPPDSDRGTRRESGLPGRVRADLTCNVRRAQHWGQESGVEPELPSELLRPSSVLDVEEERAGRIRVIRASDPVNRKRM